MDQFISAKDVCIIMFSAFGIALAVLAEGRFKSLQLGISGLILVITTLVLQDQYDGLRQLIHLSLYFIFILVGSYVRKRYVKPQ